jgi:hypothetical protein
MTGEHVLGGILVRYEPAVQNGLIPEGTYRVSAVVNEPHTSASGRPYRRVTACVIEGPHRGTVLYQFLAVDSPAASWVWENVVEHPEQLVPGFIYDVDVTHEEYESQERARCSTMHRVERRDLL